MAHDKSPDNQSPWTHPVESPTEGSAPDTDTQGIHALHDIQDSRDIPMAESLMPELHSLPDADPRDSETGVVSSGAVIQPKDDPSVKMAGARLGVNLGHFFPDVHGYDAQEQMMLEDEDAGGDLRERFYEALGNALRDQEIQIQIAHGVSEEEARDNVKTYTQEMLEIMHRRGPSFVGDIVGQGAWELIENLTHSARDFDTTIDLCVELEDAIIEQTEWIKDNLAALTTRMEDLTGEDRTPMTVLAAEADLPIEREEEEAILQKFLREITRNMGISAEVLQLGGAKKGQAPKRMKSQSQRKFEELYLDATEILKKLRGRREELFFEWRHLIDMVPQGRVKNVRYKTGPAAKHFNRTRASITLMLTERDMEILTGVIQEDAKEKVKEVIKLARQTGLPGEIQRLMNHFSSQVPAIQRWLGSHYIPTWEELEQVLLDISGEQKLKGIEEYMKALLKHMRQMRESLEEFRDALNEGLAETEKNWLSFHRMGIKIPTNVVPTKNIMEPRLTISMMADGKGDDAPMLQPHVLDNMADYTGMCDGHWQGEVHTLRREEHDGDVTFN